MTAGARDGGADRGSAGLLVLWAAALVLATAVAAVLWGGAVVARHRAARTADLAALAAAGRLAAGAGDGCATAVRVADAARAAVVGCRILRDRSVLVVVEVPVPTGSPGGLRLDVPPARARARAGAPPVVLGGGNY